MNKQEYEKKKIKERKKNSRNMLDIFEKISLKQGGSFNKWKYIKDKFKKSTYFEDGEYITLAKEFIFYYSTLCKKEVIDLPNRIKEVNKTKGYDADVMAILCILQKIYEANEEKLTNRKLIMVWGLLFDNEVYKETKRWSGTMRKQFKKRKKKRRTPSEYEKFFKYKNDKYLAKNSFQKYKNKVDINKIKDYMEAILDVYGNSTSVATLSQSFEEGFEIYINNLELKNLKKIENVPDNYDVILRLLKEISVNVIPGKCNNSRVLNFIFMNYRDVFIKSFF